ncbi:MAG: hypothetical protein JWP37_1130 [Mucilaginibacter sp.]|nr:hypothetical protein [Mucilaginibacter sp.]
MKRLTLKYLGIIIGALYGLLLRYFIFGKLDGQFSFTDLFSITFIWIVPVLIGVTPMLFATNDQLRSKTYRVLIPFFTTLLFFIFCFITRVEDLLCIFIISMPFLLGGVMGGLIFGEIILRYRDRKGILYSILLVPVFAGMIEEQFKIPSSVYEIKNSVIINSTADKIWKNVIRVKNIGQGEYPTGFFNYAGVPRPLYAELDKDGIGAKRVGHFEGGLVFNETVNEWILNKRISFNIQVIPVSIRETIFDQHILKGNHFKFLSATYQLTKISDKKTLLTLSSTYQLDTRINFYASIWGDELLSDFQQRLLNVIKKRCDKQ